MVGSQYDDLRRDVHEIADTETATAIQGAVSVNQAIASDGNAALCGNPDAAFEGGTRSDTPAAQPAEDEGPEAMSGKSEKEVDGDEVEVERRVAP